jgi:very-short-patch-repair endonuclease
MIKTIPCKNNKLTIKQRQQLISQRKNELLAKQTPGEYRIEQLLLAIKIRYIAQKGFLTHSSFVIVDFYLPKPYRLCIEIDGVHHSNPEQSAYDEIRTQYLRSRKMRVLRLSNAITKNLTPQQLKYLIIHTK